MGICSSCKKESPEGKRYCSECEERLRAKLSALESDLAKEDEEKRKKEDEKRKEEEKRRREEQAREEESRASAARQTESGKKPSGKKSEDGRGSGRHGAKGSSGEDKTGGAPRSKADGASQSDENRGFRETPVTPAEETDDSDASDIVTARLLAGAVDLSAAIAGGLLLGRIMNFLGWVWVVAFLLLKDALFDGASPGKKLLGLVVRRARAGDLADTNNSVIRNLTIAAGPILMGIGNLLMIDIPIIPDPFAPIGAGLMLLGTVVTVTTLSLEFYWMRGDVSHRRFGDKIARTTVEWSGEDNDDTGDEGPDGGDWPEGQGV